MIEIIRVATGEHYRERRIHTAMKNEDAADGNQDYRPA